MARYALLLRGLESEGDTPSQMSEEMGELWAEFFADPAIAPSIVAAVPLEPTPSARTVRLREGQRLVTDGPFAETREQLGGVILLDVPDHAGAEAIAKQVPCLQHTSVEVRPLLQPPG